MRGIRRDGHHALRLSEARRRRVHSPSTAGRTFLELPGPPIVVYQDLDDPCVAATFGEIMCSTYLSFSAAGLNYRAARDLDQVRRIGFPLSVTARSVRTGTATSWISIGPCGFGESPCRSSN